MFYLAHDEFLSSLADRGNLLGFVAITGGICVAMTAIVFTCVKEMVVKRAQEATRREIAAYVAEGSLDPDKAMAMIDGGRKQA